MRPNPRALAPSTLLVLAPAIALAGCQAFPTHPGVGPAAPGIVANAAVRGTVVVQLGDPRARTAERSVLGLGFAEAAVTHARVSVIGVDMLRETKVVPWNGEDALSVTLNVPVGNCRVFKVEGLDADPATATSEPNVLAAIRGVANVAAAGAISVTLNYNTDAVGRVVEALNEGLAHGFDKALYGDAATLAADRRSDLVAALTGSTLAGQLEAFVNAITGYAAPDATHPNGTYGGVHPLYFDADHLVGLMLEGGAAVAAGQPPVPLEAFRATGEVKVAVNMGNFGSYDPADLELVLQVPFTEFKEGGLFHKDKATPFNVVAPFVPVGNAGAATTFLLKDVPPGTWGLIARYEGEVVGATRIRVRHGRNDAAITVSTPIVAPPSPPGFGYTVLGRVKDEEGAMVDGAQVTVRSLDASAPFEATATTTDGQYVVNGAPAGVILEAIAAKAGHTTRRRVLVLEHNNAKVNFGAADGPLDDLTGAAYFISDHPEIVGTTPVDDGNGVASSGLTFRVTFSEPLPPDSRDNFEDVFAILPGGVEALGNPLGLGFVDLEQGEGEDVADGIDAFDLGAFEYVLQEGDVLLGSTTNRLAATWNAAGDEVTFTFAGPLLADDNAAVRYQMALIVQNPFDAIVDADGHQLGTNRSGNLDGGLVAGDLIYNAFKESNLALESSVDTGEEAWAATHRTVTDFALAEDDTAPQLLSVGVAEVGNDQRIELRFSEPLAAYGGGATGIVGPDLFDLSNYTFAVGQDNGDLADVALEGSEEAEWLDGVIIGTATGIEDLTNTVVAMPNGNLEEEFFFSPDNPTTTDPLVVIDEIADGTLAIQIDPDDPRTLFIWITGRPTFFDGINEIKARVEGISDPAGNAIEEVDADANVVQALI